MKKRISLILVIMMLISSISVCYASEATLAQQIDLIIKNNIKSSQFSGSVILAQKGKVLLNKGYGYANLEYNIPNSPKTVYRIGSLSKQLTAVAVLKLEEQKKLKLSDPISMYVPDFPRGDEITLDMLLHHTSGLTDQTKQTGLTAEQLTRVSHTPEQLVEMIKTEKLGYEPGKTYFYSNHGYILLGYVIEKTSGTSYFSYLKKEILTPLGISGIQYDDNKTIIPNRAEGYQVVEGKKVKADWIDMSNPYAAGALVGTTEAYLKWQRNYNNTKLLTKASWEKFFKTGVKTNRTELIDEHYGLGVMLTAFKMTSGKIAKISYHLGGVNGFRAFQIHIDSIDLDLIILSNNESIALEDMLYQLLFTLTAIL